MIYLLKSIAWIVIGCLTAAYFILVSDFANKAIMTRRRKVLFVLYATMIYAVICGAILIVNNG